MLLGVNYVMYMYHYDMYHSHSHYTSYQDHYWFTSTDIPLMSPSITNQSSFCQVLHMQFISMQIVRAIIVSLISFTFNLINRLHGTFHDGCDSMTAIRIVCEM